MMRFWQLSTRFAVQRCDRERYLPWSVIVGLVLASLLFNDRVDAQPSGDAGDEDGVVQLTFPDQIEMKILIDYVSQRLGVRFFYDEAVEGKSISVKAPEAIPADSLLDVLQSALQIKGLALVDAEVEGWKRIVAAENLTAIAVPARDQSLDQFAGTAAVTHAFPLTNVTPEQISTIIEPFLTQPGSNAIAVADQNLLIVTDYAGNLERIKRLITTLDQPGPERLLEFLPVEHLDAGELTQQITKTLAARTPPQPGELPPTISPDPRTNQLLVVGTKSQLVAIRELAKALDISLNQRTEIYNFQYVDAERIDRLVKDIFDPRETTRLYRSAIDRDDNLLIVTTTDAIHEQIEWLREEMDVATKRPGSAVKFYRLKYADAVEVLGTLRAVEGSGGGVVPDEFRRGVSALGRGGVGNARNFGERESPIDFVPGPNQPDIPGQTAPLTPAFEEPEPLVPTTPQVPGQPASGLLPATNVIPVVGAGTIVPGAARVSVDPNTNSIIVIADRAVQEVYADLIESLDKRRPQVMIEAKVVILDTSDDFSLGIEVSGGDRTGLEKLFAFTSFGLSQVDPVTGALALIPGRGFNFALVDPDDADAIIRALATHRRAKVTSAPRILVNDNATGTLASVTEVPFTSVNASNTVATTSFAGFAEAGTTIEATPRITDDDHLELDFNVSLNSFTGPGGDGIPPPRQTDQVTSSVTVPDGYTVVVGGLTRKNYSVTRDTVPFIDNIPLIRELVATQTKAQSQTTLFVFLKPVILRDDKFRDLKFLSDRDLAASTESGNFPLTEPLLMGVRTCNGPTSVPTDHERHPWTKPVNNNKVLPLRPFVKTGLLGWPSVQ